MSALSPARRDFLLALAARVVPETARLDAAGRAGFLAIVERFVAGRPAGLRRQLFLFLGVLRWLPALRYGKPLERLAPETQDAVLRRFQDAPVALIRKGFWGAKALVFMGYYGRPEVGATVGYQPSKTAGNEQLAKR